jgi:hypothetical protein
VNVRLNPLRRSRGFQAFAVNLVARIAKETFAMATDIFAFVVLAAYSAYAPTQ